MSFPAVIYQTSTDLPEFYTILLRHISILYTAEPKDSTNPFSNAQFTQHGTAIISSSKLLRTLEASTSLRSFITRAGLGWSLDDHAHGKSDILRILSLIRTSASFVHLCLPEWNVEIPGTYSINSVSILCPPIQRVQNLRNTIHSLFTIPSLNKITLRDLHSSFYRPDNYDPSAPFPRGPAHHHIDMTKTATSNVKYLNIVDTKLEHFGDLKDVILWPRALETFDCTLADTTNYGDYYALDASLFIRFLVHQCGSLQELTIHRVTYIDFEGIFGTTLTSFPKFRRLSLPREFLVRLKDDSMGYLLEDLDDDEYMNRDMEELHLALPPVLAELNLDIEIDFRMWDGDERIRLPRQQLRDCLWDVAMCKQELYSSLKRVVLWKRCQGDRDGDVKRLTAEEIDIEQRKVLDHLAVSRDFEEVDVEFEFRITDIALGFHRAC